METKLLESHISTEKDAPVIVLFGGNPYRRDEVIRSLMSLGNLTIYGTLSEEEGYQKIEELSDVKLVVIGGRYSPDQRTRIREYLSKNRPNTLLTEPGHDYPYDDKMIKEEIKKLIF